eukprot:TRINITY_DN15599_c0_g1_i1.p1 TRINITY_DN15599_c0_g1~~TRINITY_DN15599_c0_g1_i1.p1  ORF type:complete len:108 (-),score=18.21 TRINITY_DN15599_c0_g1_i1:172-495(-)
MQGYESDDYSDTCEPWELTDESECTEEMHFLDQNNYSCRKCSEVFPTKIQCMEDKRHKRNCWKSTKDSHGFVPDDCKLAVDQENSIPLKSCHWSISNKIKIILKKPS